MSDPVAASGRPVGRPGTRVARMRQRRLARRRVLAAWLLLGTLLLLLGLFMAPTVLAMEPGGDTVIEEVSDGGGSGGGSAPQSEASSTPEASSEPEAPSTPVGPDQQGADAGQDDGTQAESDAQAWLAAKDEPLPDAEQGKQTDTQIPPPVLPVAPSPWNGRKRPGPLMYPGSYEGDDELAPSPTAPPEPTGSQGGDGLGLAQTVGTESQGGLLGPAGTMSIQPTDAGFPGLDVHVPDGYVPVERDYSIWPVVVYAANAAPTQDAKEADAAAVGLVLQEAQLYYAQHNQGWTFAVNPVQTVVSADPTSVLGIGPGVDALGGAEVDIEVLWEHVTTELQELGYPGPLVNGAITVAVVPGTGGMNYGWSYQWNDPDLDGGFVLLNGGILKDAPELTPGLQPGGFTGALSSSLTSAPHEIGHALRLEATHESDDYLGIMYGGPWWPGGFSPEQLAQLNDPNGAGKYLQVHIDNLPPPPPPPESHGGLVAAPMPIEPDRFDDR